MVLVMSVKFTVIPATRKIADLNILKLICFINMLNFDGVKIGSVFDSNKILGV